MKNQTRTAFYALLFLTAAILAVGYLLAQIWSGFLFILFAAVGWVIAVKLNRRWAFAVLLTCFLSAAVLGTLIGLSPQLMLAGSAFSLATWEFAHQQMGQGRSYQNPWRKLHWQKSIKLLALSVGLGLITAEILLFVRVTVPFGVNLFAALLVISSLYVFFRFAGRSNL